MIKAIIFDCFGVLTTDLWKEFVAELPPEQAKQARTLMYQHDSGNLKESELLHEVKALTRKLPDLIEKAIAIDESIKNTELLSYIKQLRQTYKIGLLSNVGSNWIRDEFLSSGEQALFNDMIFSHEVGMAKPDPEIFELAAERLGVKTAECALIDDSQGHCGAASRLGMKTILYNNFAQMRRELEALLSQSGKSDA